MYEAPVLAFSVLIQLLKAPINVIIIVAEIFSTKKAAEMEIEVCNNITGSVT